jgi:type IV secretion/conjugal transfer VirB4 family ATPase
VLALKRFRDKAKGVADLLNYGVLRAPGMILCKDGSLLAGWFFNGPDAASLPAAQLNHLTKRVNDVFARMGSGWSLWVDAVRLPAAQYPERRRSFFPDPVTAMIDEERRRAFEREGAHFETEFTLIVSYTPPLRSKQRLVDLIYDDDGEAEAIPASERQIALFNAVRDDIEDALGDLLNLKRMSDFRYVDELGGTHERDELVNVCQSYLTGELHGLNTPPCPMELDHYMGGKELWPGDAPRIGDKFIAVVAIEGFPPESWPLMLRALGELPAALRYSSRFIFRDRHEAVSDLSRQRRQWRQRIRGFFAQVFRIQGGYVNEDALLMAAQTESALSDANSAMVAFGYYTPVVVLMDESRETVLENARLISRELGRLGFAGRVETLNTTEAWLGSLPGHSHPNVRRPLFHTLNFADCLPLSNEWPGEAECPSPMFAPHAPALMHAATSGATPFRFNLHVSDVGHTLVFGPTGAGKSTLLGMIAAQFRRYEEAKVTVFDKGYSMYPLCAAAGGRHYDLAADRDATGLCPLAFLDTDGDAAWAEEWLAACYELQTGARVSPGQREALHRAVTLMRQSREGRSLTDLVYTVQDADLRGALASYTADGGPLGELLDSQADGLALSSFTVFELEELMTRGPTTALPILLYLFRRFERSLDGSPALLLLDEAWLMLGHPVFREKIREWLKTLRKANCAVVMATQSLADVGPMLSVLQESCPTKVFLANEEAERGGTDQVMGPRDHYAAFGLNGAEIQIVANGVKKRHYYYASALGRRQFELGLGPVALAFVGAASKDDLRSVRRLQAEHGADWPYRWLEERGVRYAHLLDTA